MKTPILLIVYKRPETTSKVFEAIRKAKPTRLYVAADGPANHTAEELKKISEVRNIATAVDWACEVKTLFSEINLGCKYNCSRAISYVFQREEQCIILEDDLVPIPDFFLFCETLLDYYKNDSRVFAISGSNFNLNNNFNHMGPSYFFSKYFQPWGWATWKRAWNYYDSEMKFWPEWKLSNDYKKKLPDKLEQKYWKKIFEAAYKKKNDTWDYAFIFSILRAGSLVARSNTNLISNIGFGKEATHTTDVRNKFANIPVKEIMGDSFVHPKKVEQDKSEDYYMFYYPFRGRYYSTLNLPKRIIKFLLRKFLSLFN